jgi:hypothetical protein
MMVEGDRHLDQSLVELLFRPGGGSPNVFQHFMGLEVGRTVEQSDPSTISLLIHSLNCA